MWTNGQAGRAIEKSPTCTSGTLFVLSYPPYTGTSGLPAGIEQAADFCAGAVAESENRS
jgi:hypothetical protein